MLSVEFLTMARETCVHAKEKPWEVLGDDGQRAHFSMPGR